MNTKRRTLRIAGSFFRFIALLCFFLFAILPLAWIVLTSFKPGEEIFVFPVKYLPSHFTLAGYRQLFGFAHFGVYLLNSIWISILAAFAGLIISVLAGFSLSRLRQRKGTRRLLLALYFTQTMPSFILMSPLYFTLSKLHLDNNRLILVIIYSATTVAFGAIMAKSFFDHIPASFEEAAMIDGCGPLEALFKIILPMSLPGLIAIFSFAFVNIWNELFLAVMLISSDTKMTVPVGLNGFISKAGVSWDVMSAGIVLALVPTMIIFAIGQKYIVAGLTEGGVKG
jgi:multiple sugar transport system permease protein